MIRRFKQWLCARYLPEYCRQDLLEENARLRRRLEATRAELDRLRAYTSGLERGLRAVQPALIRPADTGSDTGRKDL